MILDLFPIFAVEHDAYKDTYLPKIYHVLLLSISLLFSYKLMALLILLAFYLRPCDLQTAPLRLNIIKTIDFTLSDTDERNIALQKMFATVKTFASALLTVTTKDSSVADGDCGNFIRIPNFVTTSEQPFDLLIFVSISLDSSYIITSQICQTLPPPIQRVFIGSITFSLEEMFLFSNPYLYQQYLRLIIHELFHILGFNRKIFDLNPARFYYTQGSLTYLVSPAVRREVEAYYNCKELGMLLDKNLNHWRTDIIFDQLMITSYSSANFQFMSSLSLAVLEDTGFYKSVNYLLSESGSMGFGRGRGCQFLKLKDCGITPQYCKLQSELPLFYGSAFGTCKLITGWTCPMAVPNYRQVCTDDNYYPKNLQGKGPMVRAFSSSITNSLKYVCLPTLCEKGVNFVNISNYFYNCPADRQVVTNLQFSGKVNCPKNKCYSFPECKDYCDGGLCLAGNCIRTKCIQNQFLFSKSSLCMACPSYCKTCSSQIVCLSCLTYAALVSGKCLSCQANQLKTLNIKSAKCDCKSGFTQFMGLCINLNSVNSSASFSIINTKTNSTSVGAIFDTMVQQSNITAFVVDSSFLFYCPLQKLVIVGGKNERHQMLGSCQNQLPQDSYLVISNQISSFNETFPYGVATARIKVLKDSQLSEVQKIILLILVVSIVLASAALKACHFSADPTFILQYFYLLPYLFSQISTLHTSRAGLLGSVSYLNLYRLDQIHTVFHEYLFKDYRFAFTHEQDNFLVMFHFPLIISVFIFFLSYFISIFCLWNNSWEAIRRFGSFAVQLTSLPVLFHGLSQIYFRLKYNEIGYMSLKQLLILLFVIGSFNVQFISLLTNIFTNPFKFVDYTYETITSVDQGKQSSAALIKFNQSEHDQVEDNNNLNEPQEEAQRQSNKIDQNPAYQVEQVQNQQNPITGNSISQIEHQFNQHRPLVVLLGFFRKIAVTILLFFSQDSGLVSIGIVMVQVLLLVVVVLNLRLDQIIVSSVQTVLVLLLTYCPSAWISRLELLISPMLIALLTVLGLRGYWLAQSLKRKADY